MAANNPITITCPNCQEDFEFDVFHNTFKFEEIYRENREMGVERIIQGEIQCPICEHRFLLRVTLYPGDDIEYFEIEEI